MAKNEPLVEYLKVILGNDVSSDIVRSVSVTIFHIEIFHVS